MKPCPNCGATLDGFFMKGYVSGKATIFFNEDGEYDEMFNEEMFWSKSPKVIRCNNCGKIRHDVFKFNETTIKEL